MVNTEKPNFRYFVDVNKIGGVSLYNSQDVTKRIKDRAKTKGIHLKQLLNDCGLGINATRQINDTKGMASFSLARIADYLDCSVDYLLGRTDNPEVNR